MGVKIKNASSYTYSPTYTFDGDLPLELWRKPYLNLPSIDTIFQVRQGIRYNEYLLLVNQLDKLLQSSTGCEPTYDTAGTFSDRNLIPVRYEANMKWCKSDFIATASALTNSRDWVADGLDGYDVSAKVRAVWMEEQIEAIKRDIWRILFFGNSTAASSDYNTQDGVFAKLFESFGSYCVKPTYDSFPKQYNSILSTDQALTALKTTYENAPRRLKGLPKAEKVFITTDTVYENLMASYENKSGGTETQFRLLTDGTEKLMFRGIEVVPMTLLDEYFEDSTNPWYNNLRHPVVYTTRGTSRWANHVIGTERASDLDRIDMFYDQKDKVTYSQHESSFGYNFALCDLTAFAY